MDRAVVDELHQEFDDQELVELAVTVGIANLTNRVNHALDVPLEESSLD